MLLPSRSKAPNILNVAAPHLQRLHGRIRLIRGMSYGFISGVLSAHTLLLAKSAVELLVRTIIDHVNQFNRWQSWIILLGLISLSLSQLLYLHRGLKLCSTSVLYPFVFCVYNIIAILDGLIYFRQASQLAGLHAGLIALGTIVLLGGVFCLSWRLEDIDNHVGQPQTALSPGMGMLEDHVHPLNPEFNGELENGERQPLLQKTYPQRGAPLRQRTPSLPLFTPTPQRTSTPDMDPASIWAELDDEDNNAILKPSRPHRAMSARRPRSKSGTYAPLNGAFKRPSHLDDPSNPNSPCPSPRSARHSAGPTTYRTWDPRRIPSSIHEMNGHRTRRRRTSTSAARWWSSGDAGTSMQGGSSQANTSSTFTSNPPTEPTPTTTPNVLAGRRTLLSNVWTSSLRYLGRVSGRSRPADADGDADIPDPEAQSQSQSPSHHDDHDSAPTR